MINKQVATAVSLIKMALALLDRAGAGHTLMACYLQAALDTDEAAEPEGNGGTANSGTR